jgi:RNA polymerase sigma-70 factor (ECF subfamily)
MGEGGPSDAEVIRQCRQGRAEQYRLLVARYQDRIYTLALRLLDQPDDALDAAQEAFVRAYTALGQFDLERPFAPWLCRIATNVCIRMLRGRRPGLSLNAILEEGDERALRSERIEDDPEQVLALSLRDEEIRRAVLALPEPYRVVILLRYTEEMSYEAIAEALELPLGTVKTHLHRAHQRLRKLLSEESIS